MVYTVDSKSTGGDSVRVQVPSPVKTLYKVLKPFLLKSGFFIYILILILKYPFNKILSKAGFIKNPLLQF
ncbi:hypothetical protein TPE_1222 [Treponema pedis str. T A4]|uniref:Uncharacterized protein n=1 Tax=Treponema pedis str. T A4 TaxID=1291379 RepID=S5ZM95_9SPIR|nr:hypothetical protein TPE_1222 [Treponema pedis str. T A4]